MDAAYAAGAWMQDDMAAIWPSVIAALDALAPVVRDIVRVAGWAWLATCLLMMFKVWEASRMLAADPDRMQAARMSFAFDAPHSPARVRLMDTADGIADMVMRGLEARPAGWCVYVGKSNSASLGRRRLAHAKRFGPTAQWQVLREWTDAQARELTGFERADAQTFAFQVEGHVVAELRSRKLGDRLGNVAAGGYGGRTQKKAVRGVLYAVYYDPNVPPAVEAAVPAAKKDA